MTEDPTPTPAPDPVAEPVGGSGDLAPDGAGVGGATPPAEVVVPDDVAAVPAPDVAPVPRLGGRQPEVRLGGHAVADGHPEVHEAAGAEGCQRCVVEGLSLIHI